MNKMDLENLETTLIVTFSGDIDHFSVVSYKEKLVTYIERYRFNYVIMDFSAVSFIDSAGIGFILGRYNQLKDYGGKLIVCGVNGYCNRIFNIAGMWKIIERCQDLSTAKMKVGV
ncbi:TPA: anti-sigma factor antagonist [bacterium]|jgi:stage II sporulation protein AA (anti-sigma F factor antagonist)|nr:anti-sigma factor antagonist [bacterium]